MIGETWVIQLIKTCSRLKTISLIPFPALIFIPLPLNQSQKQVHPQSTQKISKPHQDPCSAQVCLVWNQSLQVDHCFRWQKQWKKEMILQISKLKRKKISIVFYRCRNSIQLTLLKQEILSLKAWVPR